MNDGPQEITSSFNKQMNKGYLCICTTLCIAIYFESIPDRMNRPRSINRKVIQWLVNARIDFMFQCSRAQGYVKFILKNKQS